MSNRDEELFELLAEQGYTTVEQRAERVKAANEKAGEKKTPPVEKAKVDPVEHACNVGIEVTIAAALKVQSLITRGKETFSRVSDRAVQRWKVEQENLRK